MNLYDKHNELVLIMILLNIVLCFFICIAIIRVRKYKILAETDSLTGAFNRLTCERKINRVLKTVRGISAFYLIDIDQFKQINDTFGHPFGDEVIRDITKRMKHGMSEKHLVARIGGDEFGMFFTDIASDEAAAEIRQRLTKLLQMTYQKDNHIIKVTVSIGMAVLNKENSCFHQLYKIADRDMYQVKRNR